MHFKNTVGTICQKVVPPGELLRCHVVKWQESQQPATFLLFYSLYVLKVLKKLSQSLTGFQNISVNLKKRHENNIRPDLGSDKNKGSNRQAI